LVRNVASYDQPTLSSLRAVVAVLALVATLATTGCITLAPESTRDTTVAPPTAAALSTHRPTDLPTDLPTASSMDRPTPTLSSAGAETPGAGAESPSASPTPIARPTATDGPTPRPTISTEGVCGDSAFNLFDYKWDGPFWWYFDEASTPDYLDSREVLEVLKRSVDNIVTARNDCGLPDNVDLTASYVGASVEGPCIEDGDYGKNVIGFAPLPEDAEEDSIGLTCPYHDAGTDEFIEADILISDDVDWALSEETCDGFEELLEATVTHEVGHAVGLAHVNERQHGDLTMSPISNGACSSEEITLGLGDVLGLEELYPPR
jgi:hypothetical protein